MKLPNGERAVVTDAKLLGFLLGSDHEHGGGHAYLFKSLLDIDRTNAEERRVALYDAAARVPATPGKPSAYGDKYEIRFQMTGSRGTHTILSMWMIDTGQDTPRLVTAYIE